MSVNPSLILASASPRRAELLRQIGVSFQVRPVFICEKPIAGEPPEAYVCRLAREKAVGCFQSLDSAIAAPVVLGSDTTVVCDGEVIGKPVDIVHFRQIMQRLSAGCHRVLTAVCLTDGQQLLSDMSDTKVAFRTLSDFEIEQYWLSGEPCDKAGGYAIQGKGAVFVSGIEGSYSGVVGLPLMETASLLQTLGIPVWDLR